MRKQQRVAPIESPPFHYAQLRSAKVSLGIATVGHVPEHPGSLGLYDRIGPGYTRTRRADPRIEGRIHEALGDAQTAVNVGAGAGAYEPRDRTVIAIEPTAAMRAHRLPDLPEAIDATAEALPLDDDSVDAAMAVFSDHHWRDRKQGLREMRRVARDRVVLFNIDPAWADQFWLARDYLPRSIDLFARQYLKPGYWLAELEGIFAAPIRTIPVPIPHDCLDGFFGAFWRQPDAYLDPVVREGISVFGRIDPAEIEEPMERLRADLDSGRWQERYADLLERDELDLGYRVVIAGPL